MLRAHTLIQKVAHTHRYHVTPAGRSVLCTVLATAKTSLHQLNQTGRQAA
jgi:hypothetical protein